MGLSNQGLRGKGEIKGKGKRKRKVEAKTERNEESKLKKVVE